MPFICPVLALAIWMFSFQADPGGRLFQRNNTMDRFASVLKKVASVFEDCRRYINDLLGLGTHSNRKGAVSFCFNFAWITAVSRLASV